MCQHCGQRQQTELPAADFTGNNNAAMFCAFLSQKVKPDSTR
jgi:hypothetical protein